MTPRNRLPREAGTRPSMTFDFVAFSDCVSVGSGANAGVGAGAAGSGGVDQWVNEVCNHGVRISPSTGPPVEESVAVSGARPRHWKSEVLSIYSKIFTTKILF